MQTARVRSDGTRSGRWPRAWVVLIGLVGAWALASCASLDRALAGLEKPTAKVVGADLKGLSMEGVSIDFDVEVRNPYRVGLPVTALDYALATDGAQFLSGSAPGQGVIPARASKTLKAPVTIRFGDLMNAVQGLRLGKVVPYKADLKLGLDVPSEFGGPISIPLSKESSVPIPAPPRIDVVDVAWEELSLTSARGKVELDVTNLNEFEAALTKLDYAFALGGTTIARAKVDRLPKLAAGQTGRITLPLSIRPSELGMAVFSMLQGREASYSLKGAMGLKTPFGGFDVPVDQSGRSAMSR